MALGDDRTSQDDPNQRLSTAELIGQKLHKMHQKTMDFLILKSIKSHRLSWMAMKKQANLFPVGPLPYQISPVRPQKQKQKVDLLNTWEPMDPGATREELPTVAGCAEIR